MTEPSNEPGDSEEDTEDLDELRPPMTAMDTAQEPVEFPEAINDGDESDEEARDPLDVPRPPTTATETAQDPVTPTWRNDDGTTSDDEASESKARSGAEGDDA